MPEQIKAALLGAAGGIGQPLALLLKQNSLLTHLSLYDVVPVVRGVAADISHINTPSIVTSHVKGQDVDGKTALQGALEGANVVVIPAGVPRKPGMTRDDLFNINAGIVAELAKGIAEYCPKAFVAVISNPVNSTVPIVAEVLKKAGVFDPKRLFGVTTLDVVRASQFTSEVLSTPLSSPSLLIPVIGGHSGITILPLLSQSSTSLSNVPQEKIEALVNRIQFGGDEVVKAKDGGGSATLSMAYAGYRFVESLLKGAYKTGGEEVREYAYVLLEADKEGQKQVVETLGENLAFFSVPVVLGPEGVKSIKPIGKLNEYETKLLKEAVPELKKNIDKGVAFAGSKL